MKFPYLQNQHVWDPWPRHCAFCGSTDFKWVKLGGGLCKCNECTAMWDCVLPSIDLSWKPARQTQILHTRIRQLRCSERLT